ncbi:MAG: hypothetical protein K2Y42_06545 [Hyphomicrobium sp.]|jgi:hypothetical protein|uniref:hypothetical protein n=1 Tax=Hyphomicrobium sp. TaxID=82 RepID=UPI0025B84DD1|nr:hypothetical protein [Hyphomicrobium sp.]MBX9862397.1 hypothetical protein [Hyphomicrobium sp.]
MSNQVTRGYQDLVAQSRQPLPDPLHGLSAFERQKLLLMRPTWSERHRMCLPGRSKEERLDTLLEIMFERRHIYDKEFHTRCKLAELERANNRYLYNEQHLTEFKPAISTALRTIQDQRRAQDDREQHIRKDYLQRRADRERQMSNKPPKRKKSLGLSR